MAFGERPFVLAVRRDVVVALDGAPLDIRHADFLPFVDEGRAAERQQHGRHRFRSERAVGPLRQEMVDAARLVVVLEENRVPAVLCRRGLAGRQRLFERRQRPRLRVAPDFCTAWELQVHVAELEQHREHAFFTDPFVKIFRRDAVCFADREDVMAVKDVFLELMEVIKDARRVRRHRMDVDEAVRAVWLAIDKGRLLDVDNRVNAEAADALVQPEVRGVVECLAHLGAAAPRTTSRPNRRRSSASSSAPSRRASRRARCTNPPSGSCGLFSTAGTTDADRTSG